MKNIFIAMLALALALCAVTAMAETITIEGNSTYISATVVLPEGATAEQTVDGDATMVDIHLQDNKAVHYHLVVAPDEAMAGRDMSDMTDDEKEALASMLTDNMAKPSYLYTRLPNAKPVLVAEENTPENDFAYFITIYNGYFFSLYVAHEDYSKLTHEDANKAIAILNSIEVNQLADSNQGGVQTSTITGMINPWLNCTKDIATIKLGAAFTINAPEDYKDPQYAYLIDTFADVYEAVRIVYTKGEDMFRIHIRVPKEGEEAFEFEQEGAVKLETENTEAYYIPSSNQIVYYIDGYEISIDSAIINAENAVSFVGKVHK